MLSSFDTIHSGFVFFYSMCVSNFDLDFRVSSHMPCPHPQKKNQNFLKHLNIFFAEAQENCDCIYRGTAEGRQLYRGWRRGKREEKEEKEQRSALVLLSRHQMGTPS